jgi:hypothetical protein
LIAIYKPLKPNAVVADRNRRFTGGFSSPQKKAASARERRDHEVKLGAGFPQPG